MTSQLDSLCRLLRCQMTAVNQQFTHVLVLRAWGDEETAERIMEVDRIDFPCAMRIIDFLVETGSPIRLAPDRFDPGTSYRGILRAEQTMERRLSAAIESAASGDERALALIREAQGPRVAYADWLAHRLREEPDDSDGAPSADSGVADLVTQLIALIEQPLVHALVHWHQKQARRADAAWATSGAAMVYLTKLVNRFAARSRVPGPGAPITLQIAEESAAALALDRGLAGRCVEGARMASETCKEDGIADLCRQIADQCDEMRLWSGEGAHPAADRLPASFGSFAATWAKFVRPG